MTDSFKNRSNIFGEITSSSDPTDITYSDDPAASDAVNLIGKLKAIADNQLSKMAAATEWLGIAANQGQNSTGKNTFVGYENVLPDPIDTSNIFKGWTAPTLPSLPAFPALPADLKVDLSSFKTDAAALVDKLQLSWMAKFLPSTTDTSKYDTLMKDILSGTNDALVAAKTEGYLTDMKANFVSVKSDALNDIVNRVSTLYSGVTDLLAKIPTKIDSIMALTQDNMDTQINALYAALDIDLATLPTSIAAAITLAEDNTSNIIFARGRDQVAREAARQEVEVLADWASRGWSMPSGVLAAQQAAARQNTLDSASKFAAEEAVREQEMVVDLTKISVDSSLRVADVRTRAKLEAIKITLEARRLNVDFAKSSIDAWIRQSEVQLRTNLDATRTAFDARLRYSAMQIEADRSVAELAIKNLGIRLDFSKFGADFALNYRKSAIDGMNGLINAYANLNRGEMEYYAAIAQAQRQNLEALIGYYRLSLAEAEMGMKVSMENTETKLKWATIAGNFIAQCVGHHVQAAMATGNMYAQAAGMSLGGLNGIASTSISG